MSRSLGLRGPDAPDARDHLFAAHRAALVAPPVKASTDDSHVPPKDQLRLSACVGASESFALRLAYLHAFVPCPDLSMLDIYRGARNIDGTDTDDGTYLRSGMQAVQKLGVSPESEWPLIESKVNEQPPFSVRHAAFDRNGKRRYYRLTAGDGDAVKRAIAAGFPCVGGWDVDEAFVSGDGMGIIDVQDQTKIAGGHAIAIVGYDGDVFTLCNSWGPLFGVNGRFKVSRAFVESGTDLWALDVSGNVAP